MKNGVKIRRLWLGNKGNGNYIGSAYVEAGKEESWIAYLRGNNKVVEVKENGEPCFANDKGRGCINVWVGNGFEVVRVD